MRMGGTLRGVTGFLFLSVEKYCLVRMILQEGSPTKYIHLSQLGVQSFLGICRQILGKLCTTTRGCMLSACFQTVPGSVLHLPICEFWSTGSSCIFFSHAPCLSGHYCRFFRKCKQAVAPGLQSELCGWPSADPRWPQIKLRDRSFNTNRDKNKNQDGFHYSFIEAVGYLYYSLLSDNKLKFKIYI